jgi:RHS repeat-associated protein
LDETSGTTAYDQTSSPANGTYHGGVTLGQSGAITTTSGDLAVSFNGTNAYVSTASVSKLKPSSSGSLEVWFKTTTSSAGPIAQLGGSLGVSLSVGGGKLSAAVSSAGVSAAAAVSDGNWHYAVVTWDGSQMALYLDGALAATPAGGQNPRPAGEPSFSSLGLLIGANYSTSTGSYSYFTGSIDEPALYGSSSDSSGVLSSGQVATHYADAISGPVETPVDVTAPAVSGQPLVGSTLTVSNGSWSSSTEIYGALSYSYQWERCAYDGTGCSSISGATSSSYMVTSADNDHTLAVQVTASNSSANASATANVPAVGGYRSQVFTDGGSDLRGYWPLDEPNTGPYGPPAADISSSPAAGVFSSSGLTFNQTGALNDGVDRSIAFNGSSSGAVTVASVSKLKPSSSGSLEAWFKTTTSSAGPIAQLGGSLGVSLSVSGGKLSAAVGSAGVTAAATVSDGNWHLAVVTWDGTQMALYLDGALAAPPTGGINPRSAGEPSFSTLGLLIGDSYSTGTGTYSYYTGSIDEVALYGSSSDGSGTLGAGQVAAQYADVAASPVETPVNVTTPIVGGKPGVGTALSVTTGSWSSSSEIYGALSYTYQWERCGYDANGCQAISGATSSSYTPVDGDNGHALAVQVTATNSAASGSVLVDVPTIGGYRTAVFTDGASNLRGYWPLDEPNTGPYGLTAADLSSSPAAGAYSSNGLTFNQTGAINDGVDRAVTFNAASSGSVTVASVSKLKPSSSGSLEVWFKTTNSNAGPVAQLGGQLGVSLNVSSGKLSAAVGSTGIVAAASVSDGNWHDAVVTWDGSHMALYLDGVLAVPSTGFPNPRSDGEPSFSSLGLLIGSYYSTSTGTYSYFTGSLDEVALYGSSTGSSGVLSAAQVANHFQLASYTTLLANETRGTQNDAIPGLSCGCFGSVADPVNTATGDFSESATDVSVTSYGPSVSFSRTYDASLAQAEAQTSTPGPLGYGWTDNWNMSLTNGSGVVTVTQGDGAQVNFYPPVGGACPAPYTGPGTSGTYCALADVTATLTYDSGSSTYTFVTHPYQSYTFNSSGQLTGQAGPGGAALSIAYNSPSPGSGYCPSTAAACAAITSASGRALVIATNSSGEVTKVVDPLGRSWTYAYCSPPSSTCSAGDLVSVTDPLSRVTSYAYDEPNSNPSLKHDLLTIIKPNGQSGGPDAGAKIVNSYDSQGRVSSQTDAAGNETTIDYSHLDSGSGSGYVIATDPDGNQTKTTYDNGVVVDSESGYGLSSSSTTQLEPDPSTLLDTTVVDPNGNPSEYSYNASGDTTSSTNQLSQTATASYNSFDEATCTATAMAASPCSSLSPPAAITAGGTITPPSSAPPAFVTYSEYDTGGNLVWTTVGEYAPGSSSASQQRTTYELYNGESVTLGGTTDSCTSTAPSSSLPCATINADGVVAQLGYDSAGDLTSSSTPDGNSGGEVAETTYGYDGDGERTTETAPDGNLAGATAANFTTTTAYDSDGEVTSVTVGHTGGGLTARVTSYGYDGDGNRTSVTDPRSKITSYTFNADDEQTLVTDPDSQSTLTCYDGDGNTSETVPPVGVAANSLTPASCPSSYPTGYGDRLAADATTDTYNYQGQKTSETTPAPAGQTGYETTSYAYDSAGELTSVTAPSTSTSGGAPNQVTKDAYDDAGELLTQTAGYGTAAASTTSYCYDPEGDKTATVPPDGNTSSVANCSSSSPYQTSSAYQTGYSYDSLGELASVTRPATAWASSGQTTSYGYDPAGNLLTATDPNGVTTSKTYTPLNQVASVSYSDSTPSVSYGYDANGNKLSMSDATGTSSYAYDPFNELTSYENGAGNVVSYSYSDDGKTTGITYPLGSGASWASTDTVSYGYDNADELNSVTDFNGSSITIGNTADGLPNSLALGSSGDAISTSYDPTDAPSQITLGSGSTTLLQFAYSDEPSGAIASETDTPTWTGSPASYSYDAQSRVTQMTPGTGTTLNYAFDASGNPTTLPTAATGTYDDASELTASTLSGTTTNYTYSAEGERTQETIGGGTVMSASYDGAQRLTAYDNSAADMTSASYDGDGLRQSETSTPSGGSATTENFTWDPSSSIPHLLMDTGKAYIYAGSDTPIEQVNLATGATQFLVADSLGSVRGIADGTTGSLTASTAYDAWGNPETAGGLSSHTPFGYASGYTDPTGLSYLIDRYYDPATGQFPTVDPLLELSGEPYAYATDNPVDLTDPGGDLPALDYEAGLAAPRKCPDVSAAGRGLLAASAEPETGGEPIWIGEGSAGEGAWDKPSGEGVEIEEQAGAEEAEAAEARSGGVGSQYADLTRSQISRLITSDQRAALSKFFGNSVSGAQYRAANFSVPSNLTRTTLEQYGAIAVKAIDEGIDTRGVQALRLTLVERALRALG